MNFFLLSAVVLSISACVIAQEPSDDIATVQRIIDQCSIKGVSVNDIATIENGRVVSLDLNNRDISGDGLFFLPADIGKLTALRVLSCSKNSIDTLPSQIGSLSELQKLDMSSNRLVALPAQIGDLGNLTHLDLRHNRLSILPSQIGQCAKLVSLQLWGNRLVSLEEAVTRIASLEELYLKDNRLTELPSAITTMKLRYIDVIGNKLCSLDPKIDGWLKKRDPRYLSTQKCW